MSSATGRGFVRIRYTEPSLVHAMKRDALEPEKVGYHIPTYFRIRYVDQRWRRIYARRRGIAYITMDGHELLIDQVTMHKLMELKPETMTEEELHRQYQAVKQEAMIAEQHARRAANPTAPVSDDDIPF